MGGLKFMFPKRGIRNAAKYILKSPSLGWGAPDQEKKSKELYITER